jgi:hypothetical protein
LPGILIGLLLLWAVAIVVGLVVKALFWLVIVGLCLFVLTLVSGLMARWHR